ncbi:MAG: hypothetical protein HC831_09800 [Chloroflexia bacterium]|nr:hypothetical protein [Chloroflexia bacterium]
MKKRSLFKFSGVLFYAFLFCFAPVKNTNAQTISFGIYETIKLKEVPETTIQKLKDARVQISESVEQPFVGSVQKDFSNNLEDNKVKFLVTIYPIDEKATFLDWLRFQNHLGLL